MKQKILLISHLLDGIISMCDILKRFGMDVLHRTSTDGLRAELAFHSPAFILLDLDVKDSTAFLMEIANELFCPGPLSWSQMILVGVLNELQFSKWELMLVSVNQLL